MFKCASSYSFQLEINHCSSQLITPCQGGYVFTHLLVCGFDCVKDYSKTTGGRMDLLLHLGVESEEGAVPGISSHVCYCNIGYFLTSLL